LFSYPSGLSWYDYRQPFFQPDFTVPPLHPACDGDLQCSYDIYLTGNTDIGLSNIVLKETIEELEELYEEILSLCPQVISVVNGMVEIVSNEAGNQANYSVRCEENFNLYGESELMCVNGEHPPFPLCVDQEDTSLDEETTEEPSTTTTTMPTTTTTTPTTTPTTPTTTTEQPPFQPGCGNLLHPYSSDSDGALEPPAGWHSLCYIRSNETNANRKCEDLLVGLPVYDNASGLLQAGGNFGCYLAVSHPDDELFNACSDGFQHQAQLVHCYRCTVMYTCIRFPGYNPV